MRLPVWTVTVRKYDEPILPVTVPKFYFGTVNHPWTPLVTAEMEILEEKAHSTIMLCLSDDIITEVAEQDTAAGLWLQLESLYMTKSLTNKLLLKQRLFSLRMQEGTSLRDHLDKLNTILLLEI